MICALQNLGLIDVNDHPLLQTNKQLTWVRIFSSKFSFLSFNFIE